jgi:hypothetical protein
MTIDTDIGCRSTGSAWWIVRSTRVAHDSKGSRGNVLIDRAPSRLLPELRAVIAIGSEAKRACREAGGAGESLSGLLLPAREALNSSMAGRAEEGVGCNRRELRARGSA